MSEYSTEFCVQVPAEASSGSSLPWLCCTSPAAHVPQVCVALSSPRSVCFEPELIKAGQAVGVGHPQELELCVLQASSLQYEMLLLTDSISKEDSCWELRLRCGECSIPTSKPTSVLPRAVQVCPVCPLPG